MLFLITQVHTPENCPKNTGGAQELYNPNVEGVKLKALYGAWAKHVMYYIVEADSQQAIYKFLEPGWIFCNSTITPVTEETPTF